MQVILVGCGDEHTAVVTDTGRLFTFGCNEWGQLGLGHNNNTQRPSCVKVQYVYASISGLYWVTQKLPQIYTANHAIFPIRIRKITVQICGNFWVTQ